MNIRFTDFATSFRNMCMCFISACMKRFQFLVLYMHSLPTIYVEGQRKIVFVFNLFIWFTRWCLQLMLSSLFSQNISNVIYFYADFCMRIKTRITTNHFNKIFDENNFIYTYFLITAVSYLFWQHMTFKNKKWDCPLDYVGLSGNITWEYINWNELLALTSAL